MRALVFYVILGVIALAGLSFSARSAARAHAAHAAASLELDSVQNNARALASLAREPAPPELLPLVTASLLEAGAPSSSLQSLTPDASPDGTRSQTARVVLDPVTLAQAGRFLRAMREADRAWTPASIELVPSPAKMNVTPGPVPRRIPAHLRVSITFEAVTPVVQRH